MRLIEITYKSNQINNNSDVVSLNPASIKE